MKIPRLFTIFLLLLLLIVAIFQLPQVQKAKQDFLDKHDTRPEVAVLFIGNSRTFYHDMPFMVRKIADSANSPTKYRIVMRAPGGVRFEDHWNDPEVRKLLAGKWKYVVLQGRSNEQQNSATNESFMNYGSSLIQQAKLSGAIPVLYITWRYQDGFEFYSQFPHLKGRLHGLIQESHAALIMRTGARKVNVGAAWERLLTYRPAFSLYEDGNHPTVHGSYLAALMFYRFFSGDDLSRVTYVPPGISPEEAQLIRKVANLGYF